MQGKFTKDQIQKIALSTLGFVVLIYVYFSFFLGPLNRSRASMEKQMEELQGKVAASKNEIAKAANLEKQATAATARFASLKALSPEGAPIAWFPPRLKTFFVNQQIEKAAVRPEGKGAYSQPELADWMRYSWLIDLPQTDFVTIGTALAELENTEPLLSISRLSIKSIAESPQFQQVSLTANVAIVKR